MIDFTQVAAFQARLLRAGVVEPVEEEWSEEAAEHLADVMRPRIPLGPGIPVHLRDAVEAMPGGITFGDADWWRFLEYGTVHMAPQPFVVPTLISEGDEVAEMAGDKILQRLLGL